MHHHSMFCHLLNGAHVRATLDDLADPCSTLPDVTGDVPPQPARRGHVLLDQAESAPPLPKLLGRRSGRSLRLRRPV